jgi:glycosyltransferase involved in cell wall biosynthesis
MGVWRYVSEMGVSRRHGGGLTLLRIVANLSEFECFYGVHPFLLSEPAVELSDRHKLVCRTPVLANFNPRVSSRVGRAIAYRMVRAIQRIVPERSALSMARRILQEKGAATAKWLFVPQSHRTVLVANQMLRRSPIRYVTWMMDDHVVKLDSKRPYTSRFREAFARHLNEAAHVFVISEVMADFYHSEFGVRPTVLFGPAAEIGAGRFLASPDGELRLAYLGAMSKWQKAPLIALAARLADVNARLDLYSHDPIYPELRTQPRVTHHGAVAADRVVAVNQDYDGVVIPISPEPGLRSMTRLNIATKMSECLASGTVSVVIGPSDAAMSEFVAARDAGLVCPFPLTTSWIARLALLRDEGFRRKVIINALEVARHELSVRAMQEHWISHTRSLSALVFASMEIPLVFASLEIL